MAKENTQAHKMLKDQLSNFDKYQKTLLHMFSMLKKTKEFKSLFELPGIGGDSTIAFAFLVQNALQPKNN